MRSNLGGGSLLSRLVDLLIRLTAKPVVRLWGRLGNAPMPFWVADYAGLLLPRAQGTTIQRIDLRHCKADIVTSSSTDTDRCIVFFHGGAFAVGGRHLHRAMLSRIAHATRSTIISVDYRQLPKHTVATSAEDCLDGYRYALGLGALPENIVFMGDSAGGCLTFLTAELAAQAGLPKPAAIVAISPLTDFDMTRTPMSDRGCAYFPASAWGPFGRFITRIDGVVPRSPVEVDPAHLPPVLLQASSTESLYPQVVALNDVLLAAGTPVELEVWDKQVHVFQGLTFLPEAKQAIARIAEFVDRTVPVPQAQTA